MYKTTLHEMNSREAEHTSESNCRLISVSPSVFRSMDPLTALSLAGTVVQFVDFGSRFCLELYKSKTGTLTAYEVLELVTLDLRALIRKLQESFPPAGPDHLNHLVDNHSEMLGSFRRIYEKAAEVAEELLSRLGRLKVKGDEKRKWKSFEQALKGLWSNDELMRPSECLLALRKDLETQIVFSLRWKLLQSRKLLIL
jgi:hypothetical protein